MLLLLLSFSSVVDSQFEEVEEELDMFLNDMENNDDNNNNNRNDNDDNDNNVNVIMREAKEIEEETEDFSSFRSVDNTNNDDYSKRKSTSKNNNNVSDLAEMHRRMRDKGYVIELDAATLEQSVTIMQYFDGKYIMSS